jgi:hypothetical protein
MDLSRDRNALMFFSGSPEKRIRNQVIWGDGPVDVDRSNKPAGDDAQRSMRRKKAWITPTIEEADASEVTAAPKSAANLESTFVKRGS